MYNISRLLSGTTLYIDLSLPNVTVFNIKEKQVPMWKHATNIFAIVKKDLLIEVSIITSEFLDVGRYMKQNTLSDY